ncbi:MAG: DUF6062 family protein [Defluviitaleaceae bacterium]|nr:DUF6062 family protein [Defluviitaleaceae bacterium]
MDRIHTIPVLDALREPKNCAFCVMRENLERTSVQFIISPAYMEDDVRRETNRAGFCKLHLSAMYDAQNRLGMALMLHTHLLCINKKIQDLSKGDLTFKWPGKNKSDPIEKTRDFLQKTDASCYVCERVEDTFERYIDTFFHLWGKGGKEAELIASQKGYCLPHFIKLLDVAAGFGKSKRERFTEEFVGKQQNVMKELADDIEWFTLKFDHRYSEESWKNSRDALLRAMALLGGENG